MDSHLLKRIAGGVILVTVVTGAAILFFKQKETDVRITYSTSDAKNLKGDISIALDSWIGYFPFKSPVLGKLMRDSGYRIKIIDDNADYERRMKMLKKGSIDFAVCTIDSYLLNGKSEKFPGVIVTIIDESKGGDAILSWKDTIANIDDLKSGKNFTAAYTPASPSEHLIKAIGVHFDVPLFRQKGGDWRVEVDGSQEAYEKFMTRDVEVAVLWEPNVTEALANPGIIKLIGSEDINNLIVDILLVNREYSDKHPDVVKLFLKKYFDTLNIYRGSSQRLKNDIIENVKLATNKVDPMLKGVRWLSYPENLGWFGVNYTGYQEPELIQSINSTIKILTDIGDFEKNPLVDSDPYTILNSSYLKGLFDVSAMAPDVITNSLSKKFAKLTENQWKKLRIVGRLKLRPISFRSGTAELDDNGKQQIVKIVNNIRHYPNFRILIKGHTGLRGDPRANMELSMKRGQSVANELVEKYTIDPNRMNVVGVGSAEPLPKEDSESDRSYNNRLKRVEIMFLGL